MIINQMVSDPWKGNSNAQLAPKGAGITFPFSGGGGVNNHFWI